MAPSPEGVGYTPRKEALYSRMATAVSFDLNGKASAEAARK
jgi:hypothetical protein